MRRKGIPRQGFPLDEVFDRVPGAQEVTELSLELIRMPRILCQHQHRAIRAGSELGQGQGGAGAYQPTPGQVATVVRDRERLGEQERVVSHNGF